MSVETDSAPSERPPTYADLARLQAAHEQLLRQVHDLRQAYEAERLRRARVTESADGFMTVIARTAPARVEWLPVAGG